MCMTQIDSQLWQGNKKLHLWDQLELDHAVISQPPKGMWSRLPGATSWHVDVLLAVNGSLCGPEIPRLPLMSLRKAPSVAVLDSLPQHWSDSLGYLSVYVGACWWQQQMQNPQGAAVGSDKRSLSSARWFWRMGSCRRERQQQRLNTRHCPQPGPGDGMKAVAVTGRDISIHWPVDMPWGNAVSS